MKGKDREEGGRKGGESKREGIGGRGMGRGRGKGGELAEGGGVMGSWRLPTASRLVNVRYKCEEILLHFMILALSHGSLFSPDFMP